MSEKARTKNELNDLHWLRKKFWEQEPFFMEQLDEESEEEVDLVKARMELRLRKELFQMSLLLLEQGKDKEKAFQESVQCFSESGLLGFLIFKKKIEEMLRPFNSEQEIISYLQG